MIEIYPHELRTPLDYIGDALKKNKVVAIGETHCQKTLHRLVAGLIPQLKDPKNNSGLECLCLGLDHSVQEILDRYEETGDSADLGDIQGSQKALTNNHAFTYEGRQALEFIEIIMNARKARIKVKAISPDVKFLYDIGLRDASKVDEFMAKRIPDGKKSLVYAGEFHLRKDIGIQRYHKEVYAVSCVKNPLTEPDCMKVTSDWLKELIKSNPWLSQQFGFDLRTDKLGKFLVSNAERMEIPDYTMWFDGFLVY